MWQNWEGLPRPIYEIKEERFKHGRKLYDKIPIPWQSTPGFNEKSLLQLNHELENRVYLEHLCAYCGIKIKENEEVIRWTTQELNKDIVLSDSHPFHLECMRQARIYCPHMVNTTDNEYIIGEYSKILYNTKDHIEVI